MTMPQSIPMYEGSIPTSKTPKISFLCGLDKKSRNLSKIRGCGNFFTLKTRKIYVRQFSLNDSFRHSWTQKDTLMSTLCPQFLGLKRL